MLRYHAVVFCVLLSLVPTVPAFSQPASSGWRQYASVAEAGFDPAALARAREYAERTGSTAVMLLHQGRVVFAWGDPSRPHVTRSIRKSLVDLMFGSPAVSKSLKLDATLADLEIDDREPLSVREKSATVRHLLAARSGIYHPAAREPQSMTRNRPQRGSTAPGEQWFYNNWDFNALATVYQQAARMDIVTGFQKTIAEPLGLQDYQPDHGFLIREPSRSRHPAYEFPLSARDLARIGQMIARNGTWNGRDVVAAAWLEESFRPHSPFPTGGGYGYLWWVDAGRFRTNGKTLPALDAVRDVAALGLGNQMLLIVPSLDFVFVHLTNNESGSDEAAYELADLVLAARRGPAVASATLVDVAPVPLPTAPPAWSPRKAQPLAPNAKDVAGEYAVTPAIRAVIRFIDGALFIDMPGRGEAELFQEAPDRFFLRVADVTIAVERDAAGAVTAVRVTDRGKPMVAKKVG